MVLTFWDGTPEIQRKTSYTAIEKVQKESDGKAKPDDKELPSVTTGSTDSQTKWNHERLDRVSPLCLCQEHIYSYGSPDLGDVMEVGEKEASTKATQMDKEAILAYQREKAVDIQNGQDNSLPYGRYAYRPD